MKPRARRLTLATLVLGSVMLGGVVVFSWRVILDHVEAWWFIRTRQTVELSPKPAGDWPQLDGELLVLQHLALRSGRPVIYDPGATDPRRVAWEQMRLDDEAIGSLQAPGYRIIEQRFPRAAYVVLGFPQTRGEASGGTVSSPQRDRRRRRQAEVEVEARLLEP